VPDRPPFRDYVAWLREQDDVGAQKHWRSVLADMVAPTPLPFDRSPTDQHDTASSERHAVELSTAESADLYQFARTHRLTPSTVVQGAWALLLSRYSRSDDVCFGSTVSGRPTDLTGVDAMTGIFINTLPVRVAVNQSAPVARWLQDLQAAQAESRRFEHVPLTQLQAWSGILGGANLFESIMVFENYPIDDRAAVAHGVRLRELVAVETTNFPLSMTVYPGERLGVLLGYEPEMFDASTVERLGRHLRALLTGMVADPDRQVSDLPMLAAGERQQVLAEWNDTAVPNPPATLPQLLAARAALTPAATVVVFEGVRLSYRELNARANRLAHKLIAGGAGPERGGRGCAAKVGGAGCRPVGRAQVGRGVPTGRPGPAAGAGQVHARRRGDGGGVGFHR
jgi:non-ribosomal peptide synthetase component F